MISEIKILEFENRRKTYLRNIRPFLRFSSKCHCFLLPPSCNGSFLFSSFMSCPRQSLFFLFTLSFSFCSFSFQALLFFSPLTLSRLFHFCIGWQISQKRKKKREIVAQISQKVDTYHTTYEVYENYYDSGGRNTIQKVKYITPGLPNLLRRF